MNRPTEKKSYEKPSLVEYGSVYGMTKGHVKTFGPGDSIILIDSEGDTIPIKPAPSAFH